MFLSQKFIIANFCIIKNNTIFPLYKTNIIANICNMRKSNKKIPNLGIFYACFAIASSRTETS